MSTEKMREEFEAWARNRNANLSRDRDGYAEWPEHVAWLSWKGALASAQQRPDDDLLWDKTLKQRDDYHEAADKLAATIGNHLGIDIGEHSSDNDPWRNAYEALASAQQGGPVELPEPDHVERCGLTKVGYYHEDTVRRLVAAAQAQQQAETRAEKMRVAGYTRRPTLREMVAAGGDEAHQGEPCALCEGGPARLRCADGLYFKECATCGSEYTGAAEAKLNRATKMQQGEPVGINGLTEAETAASASVAWEYTNNGSGDVVIDTSPPADDDLKYSTVRPLVYGDTRLAASIDETQVEVAWRMGWNMCVDSEYVGTEAEEEAWGFRGANVIQAVLGVQKRKPLTDEGVQPHIPIGDLLRIYDEQRGDWCGIAREVERRTIEAAHGIKP